MHQLAFFLIEVEKSVSRGIVSGSGKLFRRRRRPNDLFRRRDLDDDEDAAKM
jgi:hypothetical protein